MRSPCAASAAMLTFVVASAHAAVTPAPHAGVLVTQENGRVVTGVDDPMHGFMHERVFGAVFGHGGHGHDMTTEPAFAAIQNAFAPVSLLGFNTYEQVRAWNGAGFEDAHGEYMEIGAGQERRWTADGLVPGFATYVGKEGEWEQTYEFIIHGPKPSDHGNPRPGVYLLTMTVWNTDKSILESEPFWIVFNFQDSMKNHEAAMMWARENLVPAPGAAALLFALPTIFVGRRNRTAQR